MLSRDDVEQLLLLLNDVHVRLEMIREMAVTEPDLEWLLDQIRIQELVIIAKLAELGVDV